MYKGYIFSILQEPGVGTQGYRLPQFYSTKKWFIPGENSK